VAVLVDAAGVTVRRSDRALFEDLSLTVHDGDRVGIVGINGTGKSTLLSVLAGDTPPDEGVVRRGRGARVAHLDQDPVLPAATVAEAVGEAWEARAALQRLGVGALLDRRTGELSGGQRKRVALARVLATTSQAPGQGAGELLVLDEPTNHLDIVAVAWLAARLRRHPGGLLLVTHDRHLLDATCTEILELDRGHSYVHEGGYAAYLEGRLAREERSREAEAVRRNLARRELAWLRRGAPARTRKSGARVAAAERLLAERPEEAARPDALDLAFRGTPRLGDLVVEADGAAFGYPGGRPVLGGVDLALGPGERLGVVGANGTGKSTLLALLAGEVPPTSGRVVRGPTVVVGHHRQTDVPLDPDARVREVVAGPTRVPGTPEDQALMERFWFGGALAHAPVRTLSGGERRRLQLLVVLAGRPNVLLLDEPTNDLDLDTLRALEEFLDAWPGTLVVVSHDRAFLARTTERLVAVGDDGRVDAVPGGLDGWLAEAEAAAERAASTGTTASTAPKERSAPQRPRGGRPVPGTAGRLRELERAMARLGRDRDRLQAALEAAGGHEEMARLGAELTAVLSELEGAEEEWLTVAEAAEGAG
jgi:ATP-binding cassette subfamily F protein uup